MPKTFTVPEALTAKKALCQALERATRIAAPRNIVRTTGVLRRHPQGDHPPF